MENEKEAFEYDSLIDKVYIVKPMDGFREEYRSYTAMDGFKPTEDMEVAGLSDFEESYNKEFRTQTWTNSFVISKQAQEDGDVSSAERKALIFIKSWGRTREKYAASMLGAALGLVTSFEGKTIDGKGYDTTNGAIDGTKQQYFHNAHKSLSLRDGSAPFEQSNKFYSTLDFTGADPEIEIKVLDILGQVQSIMSKYKDDKGNIVPVRAGRIVMSEDFRLKDVLIRGLKSKYGNQMSGNGVNLKYGEFEVFTSPYLSDVTGFADSDHSLLLISPERNREGLGARWSERMPLTIDSYIDKPTQANVWRGRGRFGAGFADWRAISYINFAGTQSTNATALTALTNAVKPVNVVNTVSVDNIADDIVITFDVNAGTGSRSVITGAIGEEVILPNSTGLTAPAGKVFNGWALTADAVSGTFAAGDEYSLVADVKLYAIWVDQA